MAVFGMLTCAFTAQAGSLAIINADLGGAPVAQMLATGNFTSVTEIDAYLSTPTLAQLSSYDYVLAYTSFPAADSTALGDVLSQYYALGGKGLTIGTYFFGDPWAIGGAVTTGSDAALLNVGSNGDVSGQLVATVPSDPIFAGITLSGVSFFHNGNYAHPDLAPGATLLATDGAGINMIARSADGIVDFNMFPGTFGNPNAEFYQLLAQTFSPSAAVPEPASVSLLLGGLLGLGLLRFRRK